MPHPTIRTSGFNHRPWPLFLSWLSLLWLAAAPVSALEVKQVIWGFDDHVVPGRFNLLSVLIANSSNDPFDGTVNFYKSRGMADRVGALYSAPCYLSPLTTRWVQFYVFIQNQYDQWRLEWGHGDNEHYDLDAPKWGPPATVLLTDPDAPEAAGAIKQFPDDLFPPTVAATSGLHSLVLDHAPRWEQAKRQAFLDWIRAGGKVHLLMGADGRYPSFPDDLAMLNTSADRLRIGAGLLVRHAASAREFHESDMRDDEVPLQQFKQGESPAMMAQSAGSILGILARMSQRRYSWGGIYLLAILYVAAAGPANLLAGRKISDYRLRIALFLAIIGGFALLFNFVGRRGQGEANAVHSLSYARAIDGNTYDVTQWVTVFAARGAQYTITHAAPHNLYATGLDYEAVNGLIENGRDGRFMVDIPMFSRRAFLHEAEMKGANIPLKISSWDGGRTLERLVITAGPDFPKEILEGWMLLGDRIYPMKIANGGLVFETSDSETIEEFVASIPPEYGMSFGPNYGPIADQATNEDSQFRQLAKPLVAWGLSLEDFTRLKGSSPAPADQVQLFLFARSPASFGIAGSSFGRETGYVLYQFDLLKPAKTG